MRTRWWMNGAGLVLLCTVILFFVPNDVEAATYKSTIKSVVDGDTVHLNEAVLGSTTVRLLSIDAPETNYLGKSQGKYGEDAKAEMKKLLPEGTSVTVETDKTEKDQYGRLLAYIHTDKLDVNQEMVRLGLAVTYYIWPNMSHFTDYQSALLEAQKSGSGIWNPKDPLTELPFEFRLRVGNREPDKYVGNYETKKYVGPADYNKVPVEQRVFFLTESEAKEAGYTSGDGGGGTPQGKVLINEVLPYPGSGKEFVELYNSGNEAVDLGGYILDDTVKSGSSPYTIPKGTKLPAKGYFVWEPSSYFNNGGDDVTLQTADGSVVDSYHYTAATKNSSWARVPDGGEWKTSPSTPTKGTQNK
ncbi:Endonuclease YncB, thermonuclease family [Marininema mesophilum]|uniref:Endonuclease YncB, thermonuclease family n=1 Tax=Marininema mesophilum TaxID=1048340 RepID=A0A1H3A109_9BACL|nr:thermonuclease family protein [Marininema mesophilum]SDX23450.1 Endonuclease YncB, thermonuclease family [Marininema mesophilum]